MQVKSTSKPKSRWRNRRVTTWRRVAGAIALAASMGSAWAGVGGRDQRLDIPWAVLTLPTEQQLREVTEHAIFSRDILGISVNSQPTIFDFFITHPDFAATAGRILGIVKYRVVKEREGLYRGDDAHGATGTFELLHAGEGKRIFLAKGTFEKRSLPTIYGRIVLVLVSQHLTDQVGGSRVTNDVRGYLKIDNPFLGILARIARPVVGPIVDKKVLRTFAAAGKLTERASNDPAAFYHTLAASQEIDKAGLREFRRLLRCCVEGRGRSSPVDMGRSTKNCC